MITLTSNIAADRHHSIQSLKPPAASTTTAAAAAAVSTVAAASAVTWVKRVPLTPRYPNLGQGTVVVSRV